MSRLSKLIQQFCPDGVKIVQLGSFAKVETTKNKGNFCNKAYSITQRGLIPTNEYFKEATVTSEDTSGYKIVKHNWFVYSPSRIDVGSINYLRELDEVIVSPLNVVFSINTDIICPEYLLSFLNSRKGTWQILTKREGIEGTGRKLLPFNKFATIEVPLPPLPVQQEIVRILDSFTQLTAELTTELIARKKQYEYYRRLLIDNLDDEIIPFNKVCNSVFSGRNKVRLTDGKYPVYGSTGIISTTNIPAYSKEQILIARVGANAGFVHIANGEYDVSDNTLIVDLKDGVSLKYIYYQLSSMNLHQYAKGGGQPLVTAGQIKELKIVIPTLEKQLEVVSILDRFDTLCNDLTSGLPGEIKARRKQYEYYRDKLLTFPKHNA